MSNTRTDESSLGDDGPEYVDPAAGVINTTELVEPEDFDFTEFLQGARPDRRSVRLYMRPDLIGRMEELADAIGGLGDVGEDHPLVVEFEATRDAFHASGRWFTVEARSGEWVDHIRKAMAKDYSLKINRDGTLSDGPRRQEAISAITMRLLAEQIVTPSTGVTPEALAELAQRSPNEIRKLLVAQGIANGSLAETAKVLTVDFSHAPSTSTRSS